MVTIDIEPRIAAGGEADNVIDDRVVDHTDEWTTLDDNTL